MRLAFKNAGEFGNASKNGNAGARERGVAGVQERERTRECGSAGFCRLFAVFLQSQSRIIRVLLTCYSRVIGVLLACYWRIFAVFCSVRYIQLQEKDCYVLLELQRHIFH